jgi:hypothetical protein
MFCSDPYGSNFSQILIAFVNLFASKADVDLRLSVFGAFLFTCSHSKPKDRLIKNISSLIGCPPTRKNLHHQGKWSKWHIRLCNPLVLLNRGEIYRMVIEICKNLCTLCPLYRPDQGNIVGRENINFYKFLLPYGISLSDSIGSPFGFTQGYIVVHRQVRCIPWISMGSFVFTQNQKFSQKCFDVMAGVTGLETPSWLSG